jgi:hypothetical protein
MDRPQKKTMTKNEIMSGKLRGISTKPSLKGQVKFKPRLVLPAQGTESFAVAISNAAEISKFLISPVIQENKKSKLVQQVRDGWNRVIKRIDFSNVNPGTKPIIISARNNWTLFENNINIVEQAYILDGSKYLDYLISEKNSVTIPLIVVFHKTEKEELVIRQNISNADTFSIHDIQTKLGTEAPRLTVDVNWVEVSVASDPFVIKTSMGYAAAINVREIKSQGIFHIIVSPKSISNELEVARQRDGSLVGMNFKIRKKSPDKTSLYELKFK